MLIALPFAPHFLKGVIRERDREREREKEEEEKEKGKKKEKENEKEKVVIVKGFSCFSWLQDHLRKSLL